MSVRASLQLLFALVCVQLVTLGGGVSEADTDFGFKFFQASATRADGTEGFQAANTRTSTRFAST